MNSSSKSKDGVEGSGCLEDARGGGEEENKEKGSRQPGVWVSTFNTIFEKVQGMEKKYNHWGMSSKQPPKEMK